MSSTNFPPSTKWVPDIPWMVHKWVQVFFLANFSKYTRSKIEKKLIFDRSQLQEKCVYSQCFSAISPQVIHIFRAIVSKASNINPYPLILAIVCHELTLNSQKPISGSLHHSHVSHIHLPHFLKQIHFFWPFGSLLHYFDPFFFIILGHFLGQTPNFFVQFWPFCSFLVIFLAIFGLVCKFILLPQLCCYFFD